MLRNRHIFENTRAVRCCVHHEIPGFIPTIHFFVSSLMRDWETWTFMLSHINVDEFERIWMRLIVYTVWCVLLILCLFCDIRYNTTMKIFFIASALSIIYYMRFHKVVKQTYDKDQDTFRSLFLIVPSAVLALGIHTRFTAIEILWTFSIYLESVAILPQLVLLQVYP